MSLATHPRIAPEIEAIRDDFAEFGPVEVFEQNGETLISFVCPAYSWTPATGVRVIIKVPALYPEQRPDLLFLHGSARSASGQVPNKNGEVLLGEGVPWSQISWHFTDPYDPSLQNLHRFARSAMRYLQRAQ